MTDAEYRAIEACNFSTLKHMSRSPAHYRWAVDAIKSDTPAMRLGRCVHMAILEPARFEREVAVWEGDRRGNAWKDFQAANEGREILKTVEHVECRTMASVVREHPIAGPLLDMMTSPEHVVTWDHQGVDGAIRCKGRLDGWHPSGIIDIKTTRDASPEGFCRQSAANAYHAQAAMYLDGARANKLNAEVYHIIAVENVEPYAVAVYEVAGETLTTGRELYWLWLDRVQQCRAKGAWPGYPLSAQLQLPRWNQPTLSDIFEES